MSNLTPEALRDSCNEVEHLESKIAETHGVELALAARAGLAVVGSLSLAQRSHPLTLLFEGGSGKGKSTLVNMLIPDRPETKARLYRLDGFTPKAFVSHAANVSKKQLKEVDLLPKLKDKVLLVKELAPIFRGREDNLRDTFSVLTSVLDGKGYTSATGTHGTRGYEERHVFNWIGATTPIPPETDRIMAQLGNRILRYEIVGGEHDEEDLIEFAGNYSATHVEDEYQTLANELIQRHFKRFSVGSVSPTDIQVQRRELEQLVRCATLLCIGRVEVRAERPSWSWEANDVEYVAGIPEGPHRVLLGLRQLAQSLALICGRSEVTQSDLEIVRHVAFSSIPQNRRLMLRALLAQQGKITSGIAESKLGVSRPTARRWMKELAATGLVRHSEGIGNEGDSLELSDKFSWLLGSPHAEVDHTSSAESHLHLCKNQMSDETFVNK